MLCFGAVSGLFTDVQVCEKLHCLPCHLTQVMKLGILALEKATVNRDLISVTQIRSYECCLYVWLIIPFNCLSLFVES